MNRYEVGDMTEIQDHSEKQNTSVLAEVTYPSEYDDLKTFRYSNVSENNYNESEEIDKFIDYLRFYIPDLYIVHINLILSVQLMIMNVLVVCIFLKKKNRSPVIILLSSLAISDTISAITSSVTQFIEKTLFDMQIVNNIWVPNYPLCSVLYKIENANLGFHLASVYLTSVLSAQKAIAVLFPLWSKYYISNTLCVVISVFIFGLQFGVSIAQCVIIDHFLEIKYGKCYFTDSYFYADSWFFWTMFSSYVVCVTVVVVSTGILCCKLICLRKNILWSGFLASQHRNRRSAVIVVVISVIFVLSEGLALFQLSLLFLSHIKYSSQSFYDEVNNFYSSCVHFIALSWNIGFSLNFIVYLSMGKQLRNTVSRGLVRMCIFVRCC